MKYWKKTLCFLLALCMLLALAACGGGDSGNAGTAGDAGTADGGGSADNATYELAVVTDASSIDDRGFNQGAWEGLSGYAQEHNITHQYYRPIDQSTDGYLVAIESAVNNGAKLIVCPGFAFEAPVYKAQDLYPDVKFILLDGTPQDGSYTDYKTADNTCAMLFAEEQSGFLAGYAAVKEGYRNLGFFGALAVPAVIRFGYGYIQGADYAAKELGLGSGSITCKYIYTGTFDVTPENQTKAASWYQSGTECIFGCGSPDNVFAACESVGGDCVSIGVDLDQSESSETVITSAMKMLSTAVYNGIEQFYAGTFPGGQNVTLTVAEDAVGLPMATSRFKNFTQADYDAIYAAMVSDKDGMVSSMLKDTDSDGNPVELSTLMEAVDCVTIEEIK